MTAPDANSADPAASNHAIHLHRRRSVFLGIVVLLIGAIGPVVGITSWHDPGAIETSRAGLVFGICMGPVFLWLGTRALFVGVKVSAGKLTIRNELYTRVVNASEIGAITLEPRAIGDGRARWIARVRLTDESSIWIDDFDCGPASRPPTPELVATVEEVKALLGVSADDIPLPESRLAGRLSRVNRLASAAWTTLAAA